MPMDNSKSSDQTGRIRRAHSRFRTKGIVILPDFADLMVSNVHDISMGGISFLYPDGPEVLSGKIKMDIFIFDGLTGTECYLDHVPGQIKANIPLPHPISNLPLLRCCVAFLKLNLSLRENLSRYCEQAKLQLITLGEDQTHGMEWATNHNHCVFHATQSPCDVIEALQSRTDLQTHPFMASTNGASE